jgi:ABC-type transporter Mla MlaB component
MNKKIAPAQLLAKIAGQMKYTPDLFDQTCERAAENIDKIDSATLAVLLGPQRLTQAKIDLALQTLPGKPAGTRAGPKKFTAPPDLAT